MNFTAKLNSYFLATAPIFSIYLLGNGFPVIFVLIPIMFIINSSSIKINKIFKERNDEIIWFFSITVIGLLGLIFNASQSYFDVSLFVNNFIGLSLFFLTLIFFTSNVDTNLLKRTLMFFGLSAALICIFQRTQLLMTGSFYKDIFLPGLQVNRDLETFTTTRVSAFFTEPAHLSIYLLPIFYISLRENKIVYSIILGIGILFSGSTTGLLLLTMLSMYYIIWVIKKIIYVIPILLLIIGLFICILILFPDVLIGNIEKLSTTDSGNIRLLGPLQYLALFDFPQWLFGVGLNQFAGFLGSKGIHLMTDWGKEINANYSNAVLYMLISYGIVGFITFVKYLYRKMKLKTCDIGFSIFALGILFSDQLLFSMNLLYIMMFLMLSGKLLNINSNRYKLRQRANRLSNAFKPSDLP